MQKLSLAAESIGHRVGVDKGSWFSSESERKGISGPLVYAGLAKKVDNVFL